MERRLERGTCTTRNASGRPSSGRRRPPAPLSPSARPFASPVRRARIFSRWTSRALSTMSSRRGARLQRALTLWTGSPTRSRSSSTSSTCTGALRSLAIRSPTSRR
eukprot:Amastigsp_a512760_9.p4 type:complete len:106 gc:universal Amastigsp_a512760_9:503-820(+)